MTSTHTIAVLGATGNTGSRIAELLLDAGHTVRAIARTPDRLAALAARGAQAVAADVTDVASLTVALRGTGAAYVLQPFDPSAPDFRARQRALGEPIVAALRAAGVPRVVALSSLGAEQPTGTGFITALHEQERRLRELDTRLTLLRPALFMESHLAALESVAATGVLADAVAPDVALPMVATRDIAEVAVEELLRVDAGPLTIREILGPRDVTWPEVAEQLGVPYVQVPYGEMAAALEQAGLPADVARHAVEMAQAFNERRVRSLSGRDPASTTPTTIEAFFAGVLASA